MADIGHASLVLALIFSSYAAITSIVNINRNNYALAMSARNSLIVTCVFFTLAVEIMIHALITNDFGIELVRTHSEKDLPLIYKITAMYSDKAGSLMFWGWMVSLFSVVLVFQKRKTFEFITQHATGILAIITSFFLGLITVLVDVFEKSPFVPQDGFGMNPQLENFGMTVHPPLLFMGYAGFAVVFAFTMGSLISGANSSNWIGHMRRWALFSWCTLGIANLVGAWWAWDVGNWGGYWAWDPVENAGLMPWLLATALIHSIAIQRKRAYLRPWVIALSIFTFIFTLLSPFITHGGLEDSPLHGFNDSPIPPYILSFIIIVLFGAIGLLIWRREVSGNERTPTSLISREGAFLLANLVLIMLVMVIFCGTAIPGIADYLGSREVDIERDFFDWTAGPVLLLLVLLMGICPLLGWRKSSSDILRRNMLFPFLASVVTSLLLLVLHVGNWYSLGAFICGIPFFTIIQEWFRGTMIRHRMKGDNYLKAFALLVWKNRSRNGGFVAHLGIICITMGVIGSSLCSDDQMVNLMWAGGGILMLGSIIAFWPDGKKALSSERSN